MLPFDLLSPRLQRLATLLLILAGTSAAAAAAGPHTGKCPCAAETVWRQTTVMERRLVTVTEYRWETRERTVNVKKLVPEIRQVRDIYVEMVPRTVTRLEKPCPCEPAPAALAADLPPAVNVEPTPAPEAGESGQTAAEPKAREVQVQICVPTKRVAVRSVSTFRVVLEPQVERYEVRVPYTVEKEISVPVCRWVPQQVVRHADGCPAHP